MPGGIFEGLSGDELRNFLSTDGQGYLLNFDSASDALNFLRSEDGHIRTSDFYALYHQVEERAAQFEAIAGLPVNEIFPLGETITDHGWNLSSNYLYKVQLDGFVPGTDETITTYMSIASNKPLTPGEITDHAASMLNGEEAAYNIEDALFTVVAGYARPGVFEE